MRARRRRPSTQSRQLRIELRDPLSRDDATALAPARGTRRVAALPKLGEARRSSVARLRCRPSRRS
jgi:hypothetical protein